MRNFTAPLKLLPNTEPHLALYLAIISCINSFLLESVSVTVGLRTLIASLYNECSCSILAFGTGSLGIFDDLEFPITDMNRSYQHYRILQVRVDILFSFKMEAVIPFSSQ